MSASKPLTCRRIRSAKSWSIVTLIAMIVSGIGGPTFTPAVVHAQTAPVGSGFNITAEDLRFIYQQILVAQDHAAGGTLLGPGVNQVADPQLPRGLRTVDGSFNNLVPTPDQHLFGAADLLFPRLTGTLDAAGKVTGGIFRPAEAGTTYAQKKGTVIDSQPRIISNLIIDQSNNNPAAVAAATNPCGSGGFVCQGTAVPDPDTGTLFIPNITPDFGLSAPFNVMFTFFGQFFDHGLDLVTKGGGTVVIPVQADDPLFVPGGPNIMVVTRATNQPGPDGILGDNPATPVDESADDVQEGQNTTTPWVDQNQTYTSHPSHQVFLREYQRDATGAPILPPRQSGKVLDGGNCTTRASALAPSAGVSNDAICDIGDWAEVKDQARRWLGIRLNDQDVFDCPLILTDPYGHFIPGPLRGMPQVVIRGAVPTLREGDPAANAPGAESAIPTHARHRARLRHTHLRDPGGRGGRRHRHAGEAGARAGAA